LQLDPYCIPALVRLGELLKEKQNYDDAISIYKRALSIDPKLTDTYLGLGETYYYNSQDSLALWYFEEAITQATRSKNTKAISKGYRWLGVLNSQKKNYSLAINYFDRSLKINKDDSQTWYGIGNACFLRYSELFKKVSDTTDIYLAIEYFCESAKRFSNDSTSVRNQAYLLNYWAKVYYDAWNSEDTSLTKDYKASLEKMAKEKFLMSSQIESYDKELTAESLNYLAWFANKNLEIEAAKEYSRKAVILEPKGEWSYRLFAYIYGNDSTYRQEALQNIQKALYIKQSVASYTILGSIYLNDEKYDSAYMAYQKARNVEKNISFATIEGFYLSGMALKKYDEVKSALNEYRQQSISGNDSLWYFIQMAKLYREIKKFELSLDYTRKALDLDLKYKDAQALLDSLYYHDSYLPALDVMINILERISKEEGTSKAYNNLGWAYRAKQTYNKSLDAALMAIQTSQTKVDTADAYYLCAMIYYSQGLEASNAIDTAAVRNYMSTAIQYLEKASKLFPKWISPLATLQIIYHEFIIDYEKSYMFGINMLSIGSLPRDYILNTIEAMLSAKKFDESSHEAEKILVADSLLVAKKFDESSHEAEKIHITGSLGNSPLNPDERLAMVFILIASKVLNGDIFGGFSEFGGFKTDCLKPQPKRTWDWTGTTLFLKTYEHLDTRYRTILLDLISVLKSDKKNEMLNSLNSIEKNWKSLLK
jgi:tetratricopeptide (TPR) repeat protein